MEVGDGLGDVAELPPREHRALAPHRRGVDPDHPVDPHLAGPALAVPVPGPDVDPPTAVVVRGTPVVVLARELQPEQPPPVAADEQHRPVLALGVVLLVGHPGPHDLAGVRAPVGVRVVGRHQGAGEVARVAGGHRRGGGRRAAGEPSAHRRGGAAQEAGTARGRGVGSHPRSLLRLRRGGLQVVERMGQLVLRQPGPHGGHHGYDDRYDAGHRERRLQPDQVGDRAGQGHRHRHQ